MEGGWACLLIYYYRNAKLCLVALTKHHYVEDLKCSDVTRFNFYVRPFQRANDLKIIIKWGLAVLVEIWGSLNVKFIIMSKCG